jgi:hypothetical protein
VESVPIGTTNGIQEVDGSIPFKLHQVKRQIQGFSQTQGRELGALGALTGEPLVNAGFGVGRH